MCRPWVSPYLRLLAWLGFSISLSFSRGSNMGKAGVGIIDQQLNSLIIGVISNQVNISSSSYLTARPARTWTEDPWRVGLKGLTCRLISLLQRVR